MGAWVLMAKWDQESLWGQPSKELKLIIELISKVIWDFKQQSLILRDTMYI